jgi:hypothetical protein
VQVGGTCGRKARKKKKETRNKRERQRKEKIEAREGMVRAGHYRKMRTATLKHTPWTTWTTLDSKSP